MIDRPEGKLLTAECPRSAPTPSLLADLRAQFADDIVAGSTMRFALNCKCVHGTILLLSSGQEARAGGRREENFRHRFSGPARRPPRDFVIHKPGITVSLPMFFIYIYIYTRTYLHRLCKLRTKVSVLMSTVNPKKIRYF